MGVSSMTYSTAVVLELLTLTDGDLDGCKDGCDMGIRWWHEGMSYFVATRLEQCTKPFLHTVRCSGICTLALEVCTFLEWRTHPYVRNRAHSDFARV